MLGVQASSREEKATGFVRDGHTISERTPKHSVRLTVEGKGGGIQKLIGMKGQTMKKMFTLLLCLAFAVGTVEAKTYYVDATRPNNNGNGRSMKTAKKTIQAAINLAKAGDTILVQPGRYSRIRSNNKRIVVKSVGGEGSTAIISGRAKDSLGNPAAMIVADLAAWSKNVTARHRWWGETWDCCWKIKGCTATTIQGFSIQPTANGNLWYFETPAAIAGGTAKNCSFEHCGGNWQYLAFESGGKLECTAAWPTFLKTKLSACRIVDCVGMGEWYKQNGGVKATPSSGILAESSSFNRCTIKQSGSSYSASRNGGLPETCNFRNSKFANCLFVRNWRPVFKSCTLGNCTVAGNYGTKLSGNTAFNTVFSGVASSQFAKAKKNTFSRCPHDGTPGFVNPPVSRSGTSNNEWDFVGYYDDYEDEQGDEHSAWRQDATTKIWMLDDLSNSDCHLKADSRCLDKGKLTAAQKKFVGTKDLDGKKRINGKAIDVGCYEY